MVSNVNKGKLSDFAVISLPNLLEAKTKLIMALYKNYTQIKNQNNYCMSV